MSVARLARSTAALALAAAGLVVPVTGASVLTAGPAAATTCGGGPGVTVVVDRAGLGGGTTTGCDGDGDGGSAADNFVDTGVDLDFATREQGFVCRVEGAPTSDPCVNASPANAYWGLWWSDGTSGWQYSSVGVTNLTVPTGGSVAFRFSNGDKTPPSVAPPVKATSDGGTSGGSGASGGSGGSSSGGATPSKPNPSAPTATPSPSAPAATPTPTPSAATGAADGRGDRGDRRRTAPGDDADRAGAKDSTDRDGARERRRDATESPRAEPETEQATTLVDDPVDPQASQSAAADGLPVWVAPALLAGLLLVGGAVAGLRRLRGAPGRS